MGPGVYDIHSPVVPTVEWIAAKLRSFVEVRKRGAFCVVGGELAWGGPGGVMLSQRVWCDAEPGVVLLSQRVWC